MTNVTKFRRPISHSYFYFDTTEDVGPLSFSKCVTCHRISRMFFASYSEAQSTRRMYLNDPTRRVTLEVGEVFYIGTGTPVAMTRFDEYAAEFHRILRDFAGPGPDIMPTRIMWFYTQGLDARAAAMQEYATIDPSSFD